MDNPSQIFRMQPEINSTAVIITALKSICLINGIFGVISLIIPTRIKQIPPTKNIVQWLNPRARISIMQYIEPPINSKTRYFKKYFTQSSFLQAWTVILRTGTRTEYHHRTELL